MFGCNRVNNDARIESHSSGNIIMQGSQVSNPTFILGSNREMLDMAAQLGRYDVVQQQFAAFLEAAKQTHPLYPEFSADYNSKLGKLVSTPETADAFRNHPKKIKGTYRLDYTKYPHMDKSETPWAYAYRTQTSVEMDTTSYQEFLGDVEDPFPVLTYSEGMTTIISVPEFPDAVEAIVVAGEVSIPFLLRRLPCMEYGWLVFGNVSDNLGFDIRIKANEAENRTTITFNKNPYAALETQLLREKLFLSMGKFRKIRITIAGKDLLVFDLSERDIHLALLAAAKPFSQHIENLLSIEKHTGCRFVPNLSKVSAEDYNTAQLLASSIKGEWHPIRGTYDEGVRADYDRIAQEILDNPGEGKFSSESTILRLPLYDQLFTADKAYVMYCDARISNFGAVKRAVRKKRKNIHIIIKPQEGKEYFLKYLRFDGLKCFVDAEE